MNASLPAPSLLLDRLRTLAHHGPRPAECACFTARQPHGIKSVTMEQPTFSIVLYGEKRVRGPGFDLHLKPGDLLMAARASRFDVHNQPDLDGLYLTLMGPLCPEAIEAARLLWGSPVVAQGDPVIAMNASIFDTELLAWYEALQANRPDEARLAIATLLLRLCAQGHMALLALAPPSLAAQVRAIVAAQPMREWRSRDFEETMNLSSATLRRRLSKEQTSLTEVITEARLAQALELLYTTHWPIKTVAARVGYRSTASFTRRFAQRYGLEPGEIGNAA